MVIMLEGVPKKQTFAQKLSGGVGRGLESARPMIEEYQQKEKLQSQNKQADEAIYRLTGKDTSGLPLAIKSEFLKEMTKQQGQSQKYSDRLSGEQENTQRELEQEQNNYSMIQNSFGKQFADIWKAAPVGGRTELLRQGIDAKLRGHDIEDLLKGIQPSGSKTNETTMENIPQMQNGEISKEFQWPDFSKRPPDYTPKEWNDERKTWRKENAGLFESNKNKLKNNINDARDIKKLNQLNSTKKLPEGMGRLIIDPDTGDIRGIAQLAGLATPETQEWVKIASRFQNRAKDAFGSRVTNFDLISYMKQFPGLLNTKEGRNKILRMMSINNELDSLYEKSLNKVYNKYGLTGISQENADRLAQEFIKDESQRLENEYLNIDEENQSEEPEEPRKLSGKMIDVIGPDGQEYELDESEVELLPEGYRIK